MASKKQDAQRRQARFIFEYHEAACTCEGVRCVSQPVLLAPRGVPRTLTQRPDTRAPQVFGAPRAQRLASAGTLVRVLEPPVKAGISQGRSAHRYPPLHW